MADEVSLYVALYLDEDVTRQLAALIRQRGFRIISAIGELLRRILNFLDRVTADEMVNMVRYLSDFK